MITISSTSGASRRGAGGFLLAPSAAVRLPDWDSRGPTGLYVVGTPCSFRSEYGDRLESGRRAQEGRPEPDAPGLLDQLNNLNETDNPFLFTGTSVKNTPNDHYSITQEYIARYDATANDGKPISQPIDVRGQIKFP